MTPWPPATTETWDAVAVESAPDALSLGQARPANSLPIGARFTPLDTVCRLGPVIGSRPNECFIPFLTEQARDRQAPWPSVSMGFP